MSLPNDVIVSTSKLTALGDAIRSKTGGQADLTLDEMASEISGISGGGLPSEYEQVDYIESSGTQRINTGVFTDTAKTYRYQAVLNYPATSNEQYHGTTGNLTIGCNNQNAFICGTGTGKSFSKDTWYAFDVVFFGRKSGSYGNCQYLCFYNLGGGGGYMSNITYSFSASTEICLFALSNQTKPSSCKMSSFKIDVEGETVRDFVPCYRKSDNEIGMYDTVNGQFYTNSGSGSFSCYPSPSN